MIEIKNFCEAHMEDVCRIENACFSVPWSKQSFEDAMKSASSLFLVAENDGVVVGYICALSVADEGEIAVIATDESSRRLGVASLLLERAIDIFLKNGTKSLFLEVRKSNSAAIALYKKFGFAEIGERHAYYTHPTEDALIMKLNLQKGPFYANTRA